MKIRERIGRKKNRKYGLAGTICLMLAAAVAALSIGTGALAAKENVNLNSNNYSLEVENGAYLISTVTQLQALGAASEAETRGKTFKLKSDLSVEKISSAATGTFAGTFDGDGHILTIGEIAITNDTKGNVSQTDGVLFGTVASTGSVKNLIVQIDGTATYDRTTSITPTAGTPTTTTTSEATYPDVKNVSGNDSDETVKAKAAAIGELTEEKDESSGKTYRVETIDGDLTRVTNYTAAASGTDSFGIICGTLEGSIDQVYMKGATLSVDQTISNNGNTQMTETGTASTKYYYEVETISDTTEEKTTKVNGEETSLQAAAVITQPIVFGTAESSATSDGGKLSISVSAPEGAPIKSDSKIATIEYTVSVTNNKSEKMTGVTLAVSGSNATGGSWEKITGSSFSTGDNSITISYIAANSVATYKYTLTQTIPGSEETLSVEAGFTASVTVEDQQLSATPASLTTTVYDSAQTNTFTFVPGTLSTGTFAAANNTANAANNAIQVKWSVKKYAQVNSNVTYTLELTNNCTLASDSNYQAEEISKQIAIPVNSLDGWTTSQTVGTDSIKLDASGTSGNPTTTVTYTMTVKSIQKDVSGQSLTVTLPYTLTTVKEWESYTYDEDMTTQVSTDIKNKKSTGKDMYYGNNLYAGIVAGINKGTISNVKQEMTLSAKGTSIPSTAASSGAKLYAGGIVGQTTQALAEIYMKGTVFAENGASTGIIAGSSSSGAAIRDSVITSAGSISGLGISAEENIWLGEDQPEGSDTWKKYQYYTGVDQTEEAFDLAWLVKDNAEFTFSLNKNQDAMTLGLADKENLSYHAVYQARKQLADSAYQTYYSASGSLELGECGYYKKVNVYATDGYYHYLHDYSAEDTVYYPFNGNTKPIFESSWKVERQSDSLTDQIILTLGSAMSTKTVKLYYDGSKYVQASNCTAKFDFDAKTVQLTLVPELNEKLYEEFKSPEFNETNREALPSPTVWMAGTYQADGTLSTKKFQTGTVYEQGTVLTLTATSDGCSYFYAFTDSADSIKDGGQITWNSYESSGVQVPEASENPYYLYIRVTRENYADLTAQIGSFTVVDAASAQPVLYYDSNKKNAIEEDEALVPGDVLVFQNVTTSTVFDTLEFVIAYDDLTGSELAEETWTTAKESAEVSITNPDEEKELYLYYRMKKKNKTTTVYSAISKKEYTFAGKTEQAQISPSTVSVEKASDTAAAVSLSASAQVTLDSQTADAAILYTTDSAWNSKVTLTRITDKSLLTALETQAESASDSVINYNRQYYYKNGSRWYTSGTVQVQLYQDLVSMNHDLESTEKAYIHSIAIAAGLEPSEPVTYAYNVEPREKTVAPEASIPTMTLTDSSLSIAEVEKGSKLVFSSMTPGAVMYYRIGDERGSNLDDLTKYDSKSGILVTQDYGETFSVTIYAEKSDMTQSDTITFIYKVAAREKAAAPTATPTTSSESATTVIPGNKILLSTATSGASIYYTTDGTAPQIQFDEENGVWEIKEGAEEQTKLYDPATAITMPSDGSGYFTIRAVAAGSTLDSSEEAQFTYQYPEEVQAPYANVPSGAVDTNTEILLKNRTSGAEIYYTIAYNGKVPEDPTISSAIFDESQPIKISQKTIIKAIAVKDGVKSSIETFSYTAMAQLDTPEPSIASGSVVARGTKLTLSAASGATIYYTIDGSDPSDSSNAAVITGKEVTLDGSAGTQITVKAYAKKDGKSASDVVTFTYQISQNTSGVTADQESGASLSNGTKVNLMTDVTGATIYYTTDGSSPVDYGTQGTVVTVSGTSGGTFTIKAVAILDGEAGSVAVFSYKIKEIPTAPTASPSGGVLTIATRVELSASTDKIYYTTDGTTPTESSNLYSDPILINRTTNLKAVAISADGEVSEIASFQYTAAQKAKTPEASEESDSVLEPGTVVTLRTDTDNAQIYYSTDGTEPTLDNLDHMLTYTEDGITINRTVTIKAVAYREDLQLSAIGSFQYLVETIPAVEVRQQQEAQQAAAGLHDTDSSSLDREQSYDGTKYKSRVLTHEESQIVISSSWTAVPKDAVVQAKEQDCTDAAVKNIKTLFGEDYQIIQSYDISLSEGGTIIQPDGPVEIGIPIPEKYLDAAVTIIYIDSENKITKLDTRREDGMAYATVEHFSHYAMVGVEEESTGGWSFDYLLILEFLAALTAFGGVGYFARLKWKKFHESH